MNYIRWFDEISMDDLAEVGGKNASLGEMISHLSKENIVIPDGFAITAQAYWYFLEQNKLLTKLKKLMSHLKKNYSIKNLQKAAEEVRDLINSGTMPEDLRSQIIDAYQRLSKKYNVKLCDVAVRSSATAEDLPTASFAGQQETFLNVKGEKKLIESCIQCMASLFTDRAITYRMEHKFKHFQVALSVGVQKMIRADKGSSGVAFSLDTESGFKDVIMIDSAWGLGESIVKGLVTPDEFTVFKPTLRQGYESIIRKKLGEKKVKIVYQDNQKRPTKKVPTSAKERLHFSLTDSEIIDLAYMVDTIEHFYSKKNKRWMPMDVEWAKDGTDQKIYIIQARPETVHAQKNVGAIIKTYKLKQKDPKTIVTGQSIGQQIVSGVARVVKDASQIKRIKPGEIIVTSMTDPDWVPVMKIAGGIITDLGGRTCHAAIVSRELGTPAIVGTDGATKKIKNGQKITIDCTQGAVGFVYDGLVPFEEKSIDIKKIPKSPVDLMVNIATPDRAFITGMLPVSGVGLARIEFIITNAIKIHPMALLDSKKVKNKKVAEKIKKITTPYESKTKFFIDTLAQGIGTIAAGFYPRTVIVRLSDFKTNEYRNLLGGEYFEVHEANPMLGFRGASRYTHPLYKEAFALECAALKKVREDMGFDNVLIMIPFVRTVQEAKNVIDLISKNGLKQKRYLRRDKIRHSKPLQLVMMCEVPSNVILIKEFAKLFDGFSIGSNDLTQLVLGVDRDSALLSDVFDERDSAVETFIAQAIKGAHKSRKFIGICGQAPSDYPEFADFLIKQHIDSISLNPDSVIPFLMRFKK